MEAIDLKKLRRNIFGLPTEKNVCRSLFGEVDHEEVKRDLEREYKETLKQKSTLWNFDFHNYSPVDNSSGLKWIPEAAQVSEHAVTSGRSLVSSLHRDNLITGKRALQQKATSPLKATTSQQQPQKHDIRNKSITENKQTCLRDFAKNTTTSTDEEVNVIKIVTESPTRKITKENVSPVPVDSTVAKKIDITETSSTRNGKRKRSFQPTIDGNNFIYLQLSYSLYFILSHLAS